MAGVERSETSLAFALKALAGIEAAAPGYEVAGMILAAQFVVAAAIQRRESRGAHTRTDYPGANAGTAQHSFLDLAKMQKIVAKYAGEAYAGERHGFDMGRRAAV